MAQIEFNRNEKKTVGTTAIVISVEKDNSNYKRKSITITNTSTGGQSVTVAVGAQAVNGEGLPFGVGGSWCDSEDGQYKPTQREITIISDLAGATVAIQERTGL